MAQLDFILQAFTVYVDGFGKAGSGEKCSPPKLKKKVETFRGGGMLVARKVALGLEEMEQEFSLSAFDPQVIANAGLFVGSDVSYALRGYFDGDGGKRHTGVYQERGEIIELDPGEWEGGKKALLKVKVALAAVELTIDSSSIYEIDAANDVYNFGKNDVYGDIRAALGL